MTETGIAPIRAALERGETSIAENLARESLERDPEDALVHAYLGSILMGRGAIADALQCYRTAIELQPEIAVFHNELGTALAALGDFEEASQSLARAGELSPDIPEIWNNYGNVLRALGDRGGAEEAYVKSLALRANYPEAWTNLGVVLQEGDDLDGAEKAYRRALDLDGKNPFALTHLGVVLAEKGELSAAERTHRLAIEVNLEMPAPHNNLGIALKDQGKVVEALEAYDRAMVLNPGDPAVRSNALLAQCYLPHTSEAAIFAEHVAFAERFETAQEPHFDLTGRGEKRLKIGYVSPNFFSHSVASFAEPVIAAHDHNKFHVTCYSDVIGGDAVTDRIRAVADEWRDTSGDQEEQLYRRIIEDRIDILVDLSGHTGGNRLNVFARRAAPVQVSWIGYPATTGLSRMDYRITDRWVDPPGEADRWHSEELFRLEPGFLCYKGPEDTPLPRRREGGTTTYGSFNNFAKLNDGVLDVWAALLEADHDTRLLIKCRQLADTELREKLRYAFLTRGVDAERLLLRGRIPSRADHMALYGEVDIALDTFPYNGTTTTCEALWMGVPVVTMLGIRHATRVGASLLSRAGWQDWIAHDAAQYIKTARSLAADRPMPEEVRNRLSGSSVMDVGSVTRAVEAAFEEMWHHYCGAS